MAMRGVSTRPGPPSQNSYGANRVGDLHEEERRAHPEERAAKEGNPHLPSCADATRRRWLARRRWRRRQIVLAAEFNGGGVVGRQLEHLEQVAREAELLRAGSERAKA